MSLCGAATIVKDQGVNKLAVPLLCRSWYCDNCDIIRQNELKQLVQSGEPTKFIRLGVRGLDDGQQTLRANQLRDAWRVIVRRAKQEDARDPRKRPHPKVLARDWPPGAEDFDAWPRAVRLDNGKLPFIVVFEETEAGEPHVHIGARAHWIEQSWLSIQLGDLIDAPCVDIRGIKSVSGVASYVAKYMSKAPRCWPGCKRYWRSQDYALTPVQEADELVVLDSHVERFEQPVESVVAAAVVRGWRAEWLGVSARLWRP